MSPEAIGIIGIVVVLILIFLRMPIAIAMAATGFVGFCYVLGDFGTGIHIFLYTAFEQTSYYTYTVIPLYVFMGYLAGASGLSQDAFRGVYKWIGHRRGGLAMATVVASAFFGAVSGAATAIAVTMCTVTLPEMRRYKYSDQLSLGAIACGGMLGFMIPPSAAFIIYAILTEESIGSLFFAGIIPGVLITVLFIITIYIVCKINPSMAPAGPRATWGERLKALGNLWGVGAIFILVMGGLYAGFFTPTEAGAVGAFGALLYGLGRRKLTWQGFLDSLKSTARLTGMLFLLFIGANTFNYFMAITDIPFTLARFVADLNLPMVAVLSILLLFYLIIGFFMDIMAIMMLTVPILFPVMVTAGIDPVWFGVLIVMMIMIGQVTPPVGLTVYALGGVVRDVPLFTIFRGIWPFLFAMIVALILLLLFPQISLWLPNMMSPG